MVTPIFLKIGDGLCKSIKDDACRAEKSVLREFALQFAEKNNYREILENEFNFVPVIDISQEWNDLISDIN